MPAPGDDIETRLSIVERATAARVLAAGADRDVSEVRAELRAHTQALGALRETHVDFSRRLDALERKMDEQTREMREGFATLATGMAQITALLTNLDKSTNPE